ncbi:hypothetical protein T440DRAFT_520352 [Plenodomus tracheiphilus IPT5]|uniref:Uncharacterized protein n=1 Tax=Plenodomus tracheiphilus IPT5 TaxID=1408161 RepID=A0A6A7AY16_9PLEO|nr:hypothetical protein T440DRAFT_520352 [Plenodomus tracheiphilus IPT5]
MTTNTSPAPGLASASPTPTGHSAPKRNAQTPTDGPLAKRIRQATTASFSRRPRSRPVSARPSIHDITSLDARSKSQDVPTPEKAAAKEAPRTVKIMDEHDVAYLCEVILKNRDTAIKHHHDVEVANLSYLAIVETIEQILASTLTQEAGDTTDILNLLLSLLNFTDDLVKTKAEAVFAKLLNQEIKMQQAASEFNSKCSTMFQSRGGQSNSKKPVAQPSVPPSPAQQAFLSLANKASSSLPFTFGSSPSSSEPRKVFTPPRAHENEQSASPPAVPEPRSTTNPLDQEKSTPTKTISAGISFEFHTINTFEHLLAWVRTFLDVDAASMKPIHADLQILYESIQDFANLSDLQHQNMSHQATTIWDTGREIAALEDDIVKTNFSLTRKFKVTRLQNLQSEMAVFKQEMEERQAEADNRRDKFTKVVLVPLRTFARLSDLRLGSVVDRKQQEVNFLRYKVLELNKLLLETRNGISKAQKAKSEKAGCGSQCQLKREKLEQDFAAGRTTEASLTLALSTAQTDQDTILNDLYARINELSLQESTLLTKYRDKMNEKMALMRQTKDIAIQSLKQNYETQLSTAQAKANKYAKVDSQVSDLERQIKNHEKEISNLNMTKVTLEKPLSDLKSRGKQLQSFEYAYQQIKQDLDILQSAYNDLEVERDELKERITTLSARMKESSAAKRDAPDARHATSNNTKQSDEDHTRFVAAHWENRLRTRMFGVDKKTTDLASCDAEIEKFRVFAQVEVSSSHALPVRSVVGGQLLDVGVTESDALDANVDKQAGERVVGSAPNDRYTLAESSAVRVPVLSRKERGVRLGRPENGEAAWQEVPTYKNVKGKGRKF